VCFSDGIFRTFLAAKYISDNVVIKHRDLCSFLQKEFAVIYGNEKWGKLYLMESRGSEDGIATGYGLDDGEVGVRVPVVNFHFSISSRLVLGSTHLLSNG
jgi:hypothetical protein